MTIHIVLSQSCTASALWQQPNTVGEMVGNPVGHSTSTSKTNRVVNFGKQGLHLGLDMFNRWEEPSNQNGNSFLCNSLLYPSSRRFSKFPFISILSKVHEIPLGIHPLGGFEKSCWASIFSKALEIFTSTLLYLTKISSYSSLYLRRYEISSGLTKFFRTHLGISAVVEFPRVSPKFLRTHLRISVVTKFPRVPPRFLRTPS